MRTARQFSIALNLPAAVIQLLVYGRLIVQKMTNNTWFPDPDPALTQVTQDLDNLETAETAAQNGGKGTAAARDFAQKIVMEDLILLKGYVRKIANQNGSQADVIIESAGMKRKKPSKRQKADLAAVLSGIPGVILVIAKARPRGSLYEWQWSSDGGKTWVALGTTNVANTSLSGITPNTTYSFRFRTTRKGETSGWSQTIDLIVH